eukprot:1091828-Rhodomonas_salina.1
MASAPSAPTVASPPEPAQLGTSAGSAAGLGGQGSASMTEFVQSLSRCFCLWLGSGQEADGGRGAVGCEQHRSRQTPRSPTTRAPSQSRLASGFTVTKLGLGLQASQAERQSARVGTRVYPGTGYPGTR